MKDLLRALIPKGETLQTAEPLCPNFSFLWEQALSRLRHKARHFFKTISRLSIESFDHGSSIWHFLKKKARPLPPLSGMFCFNLASNSLTEGYGTKSEGSGTIFHKMSNTYEQNSHRWPGMPSPIPVPQPQPGPQKNTTQ